MYTIMVFTIQKDTSNNIYPRISYVLLLLFSFSDIIQFLCHIVSHIVRKYKKMFIIFNISINNRRASNENSLLLGNIKIIDCIVNSMSNIKI